MDNPNLKIYQAVRVVPDAAQKRIGGGRLKGMTDINPMWRIKVLTEQFGPCGFGWYPEIVDRWIETSMANDEITANVIINLFIKIDDEWSKPIPGIGGSMLVANEKSGPYVNDECYKMAYTDAISVACKALGVGANVYWQNDNTKYSDAKMPAGPANGQAVPQQRTQQQRAPQQRRQQQVTPATPTKVNRQGADHLMNLCIDIGADIESMKAFYKVNDFINLPFATWEKECNRMQRRIDQRDAAQRGA